MNKDSRTANVEEARRVVTVVFTDVVGSTELGDQLDPESVRQIMSLYFHKMKTILEAHGGTVEKFIGDAIMAVFGVPERHEDDALRAVRAVAEMRSFLPILNDELERSWGVSIAFRTGVNTGEVVSGDPAIGQTLVTGDAVNTASRLEHAARADEILLGEDTWRLVRDGVIAEPSDPLSLKGKSNLVPVHRLLEVITDAPGLARRMQSPLVGRQDELAFLREEFERVVMDRTCRVVTVLGEAGLGKSRLVNEFMDVAVDGARVLRGRCLSYGGGITFWPVAEVVRQCAEIDDRDPVDEARAKLEAVLSSEADAAIVSERVAAAIGLSAGSSALQETFWAVRRLLEIVAADRPTVAVFDDIQWGEPAFLDLLEYVEGFLKGVPVLVLCMARPDLLEARPSWGARVEGLLKLERLSADESGRLIGNLLGKAELPQGLEGRIAESSQGNPLFVEEMLRTLVDDELLRKEDDAWVLVGDRMSVPTPASVNALLDSRLDRLEDGERKLIERASVIGQVFWWGAVAVLTPEESRPGLAGRLQGLVRKELIRPDISTISDEDAFGFSHELIREAAYASLTRRSKAEMHERFGTWLEQKVGDHIEEFEEILGYHLEQACRYRDDLGRVNPSNELALRGAAHLAAAGRSALERSDTQAAIQLLTRSLDLLPDDGADRLEALLMLSEAYEGAGDFREARSAVDEVIARATDEERGFSVRGRLQVIDLRFEPSLHTEPQMRDWSSRSSFNPWTPLTGAAWAGRGAASALANGSWDGRPSRRNPWKGPGSMRAKPATRVETVLPAAPHDHPPLRSRSGGSRARANAGNLGGPGRRPDHRVECA